MSDTPIQKSEEEWRKELDSNQYQVLRCSATERPGSSPLLHEHRDGAFMCAGCGEPLFDSDTKFESGSGWPSFYRAKDGAVAEKEDRTHGMVRTEAMCAKCGGHLGHVFPDGPNPTGLRYCMNGLALKFEPDAK
jgi:peptide-methionine (R)-S-oxide reductase